MEGCELEEKSLTCERSFHFSFHVNPDFKMLFENLTAQIGAPLSLGTQLRFKAIDDLRVNTFKLQ